MQFVNDDAERAVFASLDIIGLAIFGLIIAWLAFINQLEPDDQVKFNPVNAVLIFILFLIPYGIAAYQLRNQRFFGTMCIGAASAIGPVLYVCTSILLSFYWNGGESLAQNGFVFYLVIFVFLFLVSTSILFTIRLLSFPLVYVLRRFRTRRLN